MKKEAIDLHGVFGMLIAACRGCSMPTKRCKKVSWSFCGRNHHVYVSSNPRAGDRPLNNISQLVAPYRRFRRHIIKNYYFTSSRSLWHPCNGRFLLVWRKEVTLERERLVQLDCMRIGDNVSILRFRSRNSGCRCRYQGGAKVRLEFVIEGLEDI